VATHLENLEKSGNSKVVREKSGKMEKVRETEICFIEELKLQLLASCWFWQLVGLDFGYVHH